MQRNITSLKFVNTQRDNYLLCVGRHLLIISDQEDESRTGEALHNRSDQT